MSDQSKTVILRLPKNVPQDQILNGQYEFVNGAIVLTESDGPAIHILQTYYGCTKDPSQEVASANSEIEELRKQVAAAEQAKAAALAANADLQKKVAASANAGSQPPTTPKP